MNPNQTYNIVLADEDEDDYAFLQDVLNETKQATLYRASNKQYLFQHLSNATAVPDAIFLGFTEHGNDVCECLRAIRQQPQYLSVPLVIFSDIENPMEIENMYASGANMYIKKPSTAEQMKLSMTHFINLFLKNYSLQVAN